MLRIWECTFRASTRDQDAAGSAGEDAAGSAGADPREYGAGSGILGMFVCTVKLTGS